MMPRIQDQTLWQSRLWRLLISWTRWRFTWYIINIEISKCINICFENASISMKNTPIKKSKCINIRFKNALISKYQNENEQISTLKMQDKDGFVTKNEFLAISSKITPAQVVFLLKVFESFSFWVLKRLNIFKKTWLLN